MYFHQNSSITLDNYINQCIKNKSINWEFMYVREWKNIFPKKLKHLFTV